MLTLLNKTVTSIRTKGLAKTFKRIVNYPLTLEGKFTEIYEKNIWESEESVSGGGSTLECTTNLRASLPKLFKNYCFWTVFDAPCGDFNWMKHVIKNADINYIGGDIVGSLINTNNLAYKDYNICFIHIDLTKEVFPKAD